MLALAECSFKISCGWSVEMARCVLRHSRHQRLQHQEEEKVLQEAQEKEAQELQEAEALLRHHLEEGPPEHIQKWGCDVS